MTKTVAAIVAHPDDEVLCCGGTLARLASQGWRVEILILATGLAARGSMTLEELDHHRDAARAAGRALGAPVVTFADFPDNRMDSVALLDVVQEVEAFLARVRPHTVFTHHPGDINIDHGVVARAALTATRPAGRPGVRRVLAGETISSTEWGFPAERFTPTSFVDISAHLDAKLSALQCYAHELRPFPHPRSPEAVTHLARLRGSECGLAAAEAFHVLRDIDCD